MKYAGLCDWIENNEFEIMKLLIMNYKFKCTSALCDLLKATKKMLDIDKHYYLGENSILNNFIKNGGFDEI